MENLRKKNETEIQNKMEGHASRLEQVEGRIPELFTIAKLWKQPRCPSTDK
jgi:hypothetical protein